MKGQIGKGRLVHTRTLATVLCRLALWRHQELDLEGYGLAVVRSMLVLCCCAACVCFVRRDVGCDLH